MSEKFANLGFVESQVLSDLEVGESGARLRARVGIDPGARDFENSSEFVKREQFGVLVVLLSSSVAKPPRAIRQAATLTDGTESKSANRTFFDARKTTLDEKISLTSVRVGSNQPA